MALVHEENGYCNVDYSSSNNVKGGSTTTQNANANETQGPEEPTQLDIVINNVVCSFSVRCHLNLREIALHASNVEYRRENGMVTMKMRKPYTTASMWSSGKITCTGATSEDLAKVAARKFSRMLQKLGFKVRLSNYRVVNVLGTCAMPFAIRIIQFSNDHRANASYEPELHPGVTYKLKDPKATLKIFSTGSITVTAPSVQNVQAAIEHIFPIVYEYRRNAKEGEDDKSATKTKRRKGNTVQRHNHNHTQEENDIFMSSEDDGDNLFDSDRSWD